MGTPNGEKDSSQSELSFIPGGYQGVLCTLQSQPRKPSDCVMRLGQSGQSGCLCNSLVLSSKFDQVWELSKFKLKTNHYGHSGYINAVSVSPDGSLAASGGKDGITMLWDLNEGKHLYSLEAGDIVNALVFSPNRYWLCAATASCIKIFDLESK